MEEITKGMLEQLYEDIASSPHPPEFVRFQGLEYKTGSKELQEAIDEWRKQRSKKVK